MNHKVALITGASSGIGAELSKTLARDKWNLVLLARRGEILNNIKKNLVKDFNIKVEVYPCDINDTEKLQDVIQKAFKKFLHIDLVVLNAGISDPVPVNKFNVKKIKEIYETNVFGALNIVSLILPNLLSTKKESHIVGISSLTAYKAFAKTHPYGASKSALSAHLEGLRAELSSTNIRVSTICPGFIKTPMTEKNKFPMPFLMDVDIACLKIKKAIYNKTPIYNFPWQSYYLLKLSTLLPKKILDLLNKRIKI